jgi:hypothetical protein
MSKQRRQTLCQAPDPFEVTERATVDVVAHEDLLAGRRQLGDGGGDG